METLPYDLAILAFILLGLIVGYCFARRIANTRLRQENLTLRQRFVGVVTLSSGALLGWGYWYHIEPQYCVAAIAACERPGDPDPGWAEARLVRMGSRSFEAIFEGVSGNGVFNRGTCLLPYTLVKMGPPAHDALLAAIDRAPEGDPGLIYTLLTTFGDSSRLPRWIDYAILRDRRDYDLSNCIRNVYADAPPLLGKAEGINPDFITWYRKRFPNRLPAHNPLERW